MSTIATDTVGVLPAGAWAFDAVHSSIAFEIGYMGGAFRGTFGGVEARLANGELSGSARVENVRVEDENLATHLLAPDFFDAERHPELSFASSALDISGDQLTVEGTLTIKGTTQPVVLEGTIAAPVVDPYGRQRLGIQLATTIDRTQFGIDWNVPLPSGEPALSNDVRLIAQLFLIQEA
jgi:polyisoprenoid-binding protein YceI